MGEIKTVYSDDQLSVTDLRRDVAKNTTPPVETNVLEVKTADEWIEKAKTNQFSYHYSIVYGILLTVNRMSSDRLRGTFLSKYKKIEAGYNL